MHFWATDRVDKNVYNNFWISAYSLKSLKISRSIKMPEACLRNVSNYKKKC